MRSFDWKTKDNLSMYGQEWAVANSKAIMILVHGLGEHIGRYDHFAAYYNQKRISVAGFDLRGHGKSEGRKGHIPSYRNVIDDLDIFINNVIQKYPSIPVILYGHSMGGNVVLNYVRNKPTEIDLCISTSPWIELAFNPLAILLSIAKAIRKLWPSFSQDNGLEKKALSRDQKVVDAYERDPLVHSKVTANTVIELMDAGQSLLNDAYSFKKPVLLMHGSADRITAHNASSMLAGKHPEIHFKSWKGFYHEMHNEPEKEDFFQFSYNWILPILEQL